MRGPLPDADDLRNPRGLPPVREVWRRPLPHLDGQAATRFMCRTLLTLFRGRLREISGAGYVLAECDPFILALNHSQRPEAVLIPAWLCFHRGGRMVHFMADWNFQLVPGLAWLIRLHDPILVVRKDARPRFLNRFKARYRKSISPFAEARGRLLEGRSVGVFPEGTVNRDPVRLLRGQTGVARLAIEAQVPVVPGGIRFPRCRPGDRVSDFDPMAVAFGPPIVPPGDAAGDAAGEPGRVQELHTQIMGAISTLSGKQWQPDASRTRYAFSNA